MRSFSNIMTNFAGNLHLLVDSIPLLLNQFIVVSFVSSDIICNFAPSF